MELAFTRDLSRRIDPVLDQAVEERRIVGMVVLVARDGKLVYRRAAGFLDREQGRPMQENALFRLASVTKPIVTTALLTLVEDGTISLDDPVTRWLPEFRPALSNGERPVIEVWQLLSHTAGLNYGFNEAPDGPLHQLKVSDGLDRVDFDLEENLRRLAQAPLLFYPGSNWQYSLGTDTMGRMLEKVAEKPLADLVRERVTGPLQMMETDFRTKPSDRLAVPYADGPDGAVLMTDPHLVPYNSSALRFSPSRLFDPTAYSSAGVGMVGTAGDFLRLLEVLRTGGGPLFGPGLWAELVKNRIGSDFSGRPDPGWGFGLGFSILEDPVEAATPQPVGTWRWGGVYGHHWFVDSEDRLSMVVFTNTAVAGTNGIFPESLRNAVYEK